MATVGLCLLAYVDSGKNEPPEGPAMEAVDNFLCTVPQQDLRGLRPPVASLRPPSFLGANQYPKQGQANGASPKAPDENRKARRARIKKERSKLGKR